ncbi:hypothetical protein H3H37_12560 [Duganella sp. LX20W]|uniref:Uncharacterized protein n=1 Tax=Rugamonas brunnea TaxID=2758569 RepID=A0A7W2IBU7_9BURK|nr:hypothetical protein [Rugamonas brunnea]MBA5637886.1 hypothetical protein [Rugamonas brunnea]
MSYFMTISGAISAVPAIDGIELLLADDAQKYIKSLANELACLDGTPVHLVHDCETGTSDVVIADLENALLDGKEVYDLPAARILQACFDNGLSFRIWWANNDRDAYISNALPVSDLRKTFEAIKAHRGAIWGVSG